MEDYRIINADPSNKPETIALYRSPMARLTGRKFSGEFLLMKMEYERPYVSKVIVDEENQVEHWRVEKQFWLKFKKEFQEFGFLPTTRMNLNKKIPYMQEQF